MSISAKILKTARTMYLYGDGHAVIIHEKNDKQAGRVQWATLHESIGVKADFTGRLIISHAGAMAMLLASDAVRCTEPSITHGSENTRKLNIAVGNVSFDFGAGYTHFNLLDGLISCDFHYQADDKEAWADIADSYHWADYTVSNKYLLAA